MDIYNEPIPTTMEYSPVVKKQKTHLKVVEVLFQMAFAAEAAMCSKDANKCEKETEV